MDIVKEIKRISVQGSINALNESLFSDMTKVRDLCMDMEVVDISYDNFEKKLFSIEILLKRIKEVRAVIEKLERSLDEEKQKNV